MDLGSKNANDLIKKDYLIQKNAANSIINDCDVNAFHSLVKNSEFIFDFIKEKMVKNLIQAVNFENVYNLFAFLKFYSPDFEDFVVFPLIKFKDKTIDEKICDILKNGNEDEKTYAVIFYTKTNQQIDIELIRTFLKTDFDYLKSACIKYLSKFNEKDIYLEKIEILKNSNDEFEKLDALDFLIEYKDKESFKTVYDYFQNSIVKEIVAPKILLLKNFTELIKECEADKIYKIYSSLLQNFPENFNFQELNYYLKEEGLLEFLMESEGEYPVLLNFMLKNKLKLILENEAYSIELDKNDKEEAKKLLGFVESILEYEDEKQVITNILISNEKEQVLLALDILLDEKIELSDTLKDLIKNSNDEEVLSKTVQVLYSIKKLTKQDIILIESKIKNPILKEEIKTHLDKIRF